MHEAFLWSETRTATKTATVSLHGNTFEVDAALVGHRVEVVFDPFALDTVQIRFGRPMGAGVPHRISRHSHPKARPDTPAPPAPPTTGIDDLGLVAARHEAELARAINDSQLTLPDEAGPDSAVGANNEEMEA